MPISNISQHISILQLRMKKELKGVIAGRVINEHWIVLRNDDIVAVYHSLGTCFM